MIHGLDAVIWCLLFMMAILRYHGKVTEREDTLLRTPRTATCISAILTSQMFKMGPNKKNCLLKQLTFSR